MSPLYFFRMSTEVAHAAVSKAGLNGLNHTVSRLKPSVLYKCRWQTQLTCWFGEPQSRMALANLMFTLRDSYVTFSVALTNPTVGLRNKSITRPMFRFPCCPQNSAIGRRLHAFDWRLKIPSPLTTLQFNSYSFSSLVPTHCRIDIVDFLIRRVNRVAL